LFDISNLLFSSHSHIIVFWDHHQIIAEIGFTAKKALANLHLKG